MQTAKSVVISCAGVGSRLGMGQTKALLNIAGRPLIHWQLEFFADVEDVRIVVGYQAAEVVREVLKIRKDITFVYNHDYVNTKTGASLYAGAKDAGEYILAWDGDLLVHPNDVKMCLEESGEFICFSEVVSDEAVFVRLSGGGDVVSFSLDGGDFEWSGPACVRKERLFYSSDNVFRILEPCLPMRGIKVRARDVDTYNDYINIIEFVKSWK